jgi:hypothetical protein
MTNLRKSFILLSAAITMGNLEQAQASAKKQSAQDEQKVAGAEKNGERQRVSKQKKAHRRPIDSDFNLGMPSGSAYDVISRAQLS